MNTAIKLNLEREIVSPEKILIGKDILELLSSAMYVDPLNLFREYVQNAVDSIDRSNFPDTAQIDIHLDPNARRIKIRDNGTGLANGDFATTMTAIGGSQKRNIPGSRGFRGVGRLAGLGYCRSLSFQSKGENDKEVLQITWDCVKFKRILRNAKYSGHLEDVIKEVSTVTSRPAEDQQAFFEVTLEGIVRLKNDVLLNGPVVMNYLSQVAPVPFRPDFRFALELEELLKDHGINSGYKITVAESNLSNNEPETIYRPFRNEFNSTGSQVDEVTAIRQFELHDLQGDIGAIGWVADTNYYGAIPTSSLVRGIRLRAGNIQIGESNIVASEFPESRFNSWSIGEIHVLSKKIIPNGRRDNFEEDVHFENLLSELQPHFKKIAQSCRSKSSRRQWTVRFNSKVNVIEQDLVILESRSLNKREIPKVLKTIQNGIFELEELISSSNYDWVKSLTGEVDRLREKLAKASGKDKGDREDPLAIVPYQKRLAFQEIFKLIYDISVNKEAGNIMVDKLLKRIASKYS